ncbi:MAG: type II toxin-antitoxin system Phd/YefM family antitoxin [Roseburia sp.]|nr:type II toxin-antitoxin system Phd/YefM family antitoxin [Roseburia sp.]
MPHIIPIKDLKNTSEISELCHKTDEPIYITKNGYGDMVIMSMEIFESTMRQLSMYRDIEISEKQIDKLLENPLQFPLSRDTYLANKGYHEAIVPQMDYIVVFSMKADIVNVVGIFHQLKNYQRKMYM